LAVAVIDLVQMAVAFVRPTRTPLEDVIDLVARGKPDGAAVALCCGHEVDLVVRRITEREGIDLVAYLGGKAEKRKCLLLW